MPYKEDLDNILETLKKAVEDHLTREQVRIDGLVAKIQEAAQQIRVVNANDEALLLEITSAARELENYNPVTIFDDLHTANIPYNEERGESEVAEASASGLAATSAPGEASDPGAKSDPASGLAANSAPASGLAAASEPGLAATSAPASGLAANSAPASGLAAKSAWTAASAKHLAAAPPASAAEKAVAKRNLERNRQIRKLENEMNILVTNGKKGTDDYKNKKSQISVLQSTMGTGGGRKQTRRRKRHSFRRK
jgi:hypothetical protein